MRTFQLFKKYSLKHFKKHKLLICACIISIILGTASLYFTSMLTDYFQQQIQPGIFAMNGSAAIKIQAKDYFKNSFSEDEKNKILELGKEHTYTIGRNVLTNCIVNDNIYNVILNTRVVTTNKTDDVAELSEDETILSANVAKRLNIQVGDKIYLKLHSQVKQDHFFVVKKIIQNNYQLNFSDTEQEHAQNIIGEAWIHLPEEIEQNYAYLNLKQSENEKQAVSLLKEGISSHFFIRTKTELERKIKPRINLQINAIKLIGTLTFLVSGICISCVFLFFIYQRVKDYVTMKVLGMNNRQLAQLILLELVAMTTIGLLIGLIIGNIGLEFYLQFITQKNNLLLSLPIVKNTIMSMLVIYLETCLFSIIPITYAQTITYQSYTKNQTQSTKNKARIIGAAFSVVLFLAVMLSIYSKSLLGLLFVALISLISAIIFFLSYQLIRLLSKFRCLLHNQYHLSFLFLKRSVNVFALSTAIFSFTMMIILVLTLIPNMLTSISVNGDKEVEKHAQTVISYQTNKTAKPIMTKFLDHTHITAYSSSHLLDANVEAINGRPLEKFLLTTGIAKEYLLESLQAFQQIPIRLIEHAPLESAREDLAGDEWLNKELDQQIVINPNLYLPEKSYQIGDRIALQIDGGSKEYEVCGFLKNTSGNQGLFGYIYDKSLLENSSQKIPVEYRFYGQKLSELDLVNLLVKDPAGYVEEESSFTDIVKDFVKQQKFIFSSLIFISVFSSLFLVICIQFIVNYQRLPSYKIMFRFGLSDQKLRRIILVEKMSLSFIQTIIIQIFIEPIRFLVVSEFSQNHYYPSYKLFILLYLLLVMINYGAYLLTQVTLKTE